MHCRTAALLAALALMPAACGNPAVRHAPPGRTWPATPPAAAPRALAVLHRWDARRALAWADGDPAALRVLYAPGSVAGRRDVALLREYAARGYRVRGLTTQVLRARVVVERPGLIRIDLTDRLAAAVAVRSDGSSAPLPAAAPRHRLVELRRERGVWVVDRVEFLSPGSRLPGRR